MAINQAYGARHQHTGAGPGRLVKGLSALDLVVEANLLPATAGPLEFANWLREPLTAIIDDLGQLVVPIVAETLEPYVLEVAIQADNSEEFASASFVNSVDAADFAAHAEQMRDEVQALSDSIEAATPVPLTVQELLAGVDNLKYPTAATLRATTDPELLAFTATPAPDFTNSSYRKMTLTGNVTSVGAPVGMNIGQSYTFDLIEDGTGGRTIPSSGNWNGAYDWGSEGFPASFATGANKVNTLFLFCYATGKAWTKLTKSA